MKFFSLRREECQFKFPCEGKNEVRKIILKIDEKKANLTADIPPGILKGYVDSYISVINS